MGTCVPQNACGIRGQLSVISYFTTRWWWVFVVWWVCSECVWCGEFVWCRGCVWSDEYVYWGECVCWACLLRWVYSMCGVVRVCGESSCTDTGCRPSALPTRLAAPELLCSPWDLQSRSPSHHQLTKRKTSEKRLQRRNYSVVGWLNSTETQINPSDPTPLSICIHSVDHSHLYFSSYNLKATIGQGQFKVEQYLTFVPSEIG